MYYIVWSWSGSHKGRRWRSWPVNSIMYNLYTLTFNTYRTPTGQHTDQLRPVQQWGHRNTRYRLWVVCQLGMGAGTSYLNTFHIPLPHTCDSDAGGGGEETLKPQVQTKEPHTWKFDNTMTHQCLLHSVTFHMSVCHITHILSFVSWYIHVWPPIPPQMEGWTMNL